MIYLLYGLLIAVIFGLIALVDFLFHKLFPKKTIMENAVRLPRRSLILGLILLFLGLFSLIYLDFSQEKVVYFGCWLALAMGVFLLVNFWRFGIFYDNEQFIYRTLTKKARTYRYSDIRSQRSFVARSGINIALDVAGDEIQLYQAMQGLPAFLNKAFYRWCEAKGIDPDTVENDPGVLVYFPEENK